MEVILQQSIDALGREGDIVRVAPGYANNFLIPKGLAVIANPGNLKQLEQKRAVISKRQAASREEAEAIAKAFDGQGVTIEAKAGREGKLYGSVTTKHIAEAIQESFSVEIDKKRIIPSDPLKEAGEFDLKVRLHPDVEAALKVKVVAEIIEEEESEAVEGVSEPLPPETAPEETEMSAPKADDPAATEPPEDEAISEETEIEE